MTRARERLYLTRTTSRAVRGRSLATIPSEFLREIGLPEVPIPAPSFPRVPHRAEGNDDRSSPHDEGSQESASEQDLLSDEGARPVGGDAPLDPSEGNARRLRADSVAARGGS